MVFQQILSIFSPSYRRANQAATRSQYWVQWSFTEDEWKRFDRLDWGRTKRWFYGTIILLAVMPCWWALISPVFSQTDELPLHQWPWFFYLWGGLVFLAIVVTVALWLVGEWRSYTAGKARHKERQRVDSTRTLDIGPSKICQSGICIPLVGPNLTLKDVYVDPSDPSTLKFRMIRGRNIPTGIGIPIPQGQETSAQQLIERFKREVL